MKVQDVGLLSCGYKIEIIYEVKDTEVSKDREEKIASIDLGIDNLATLISEDFTAYQRRYNQKHRTIIGKACKKVHA